MSEAVPTVFIVEDNEPLLRALSRVLHQKGFRTETYTSAEDFLTHRDVTVPGCLLLDVNLPGLDGLALQRRLADFGPPLPIVFMSGHGDIPMTVQVIKAGAIDFLTKPVSAVALLAAVQAGIAQDLLARQSMAKGEALRIRFATLTPREREVLAGIIAGRLNKQIAGDLGVVERTIKFHRAQIMDRLQVRTVAELMHLTVALNLSAGPPIDDAGPERPGEPPPN